MNTTASGPHPRDDLAAYTVGALHPHERRPVDAHLATCPRCRAQLTGYLETLAALVPVEEPPPEIWARIRTAMATTPQTVPTDPTGPADAVPLVRPRPTTPWRRPRVRAALVGVAAAVVVAVALAVGIAAFRTGPDDVPTPEELAQDALDDRDTTVVALDDPETGAPAARMVVTGSGAAYVMLDDLDTLPSGQAYQLWRTEGTTPISLGVLGPGHPDVVQVSLPAGTARLAISREPARGSATPTGPLVAAGTLHAANPPPPEG